MRNATSLIIFLFAALAVKAQTTERFSVDQLNNPKKHTAVIKAQFEVAEIPVFEVDTNQYYIALQNGLRSSNYINEGDWIDVSSKQQANAVTLVFSKYPVRKGVYKMQMPLLANRLKRLFEIDPSLNDTAISYRIILHTNCMNDEQVDGLFHGALIHYSVPEGQAMEHMEPETIFDVEVEDHIVEQPPVESFESEEYETMGLPDAVASKMENATREEAAEIMREHLESVLASPEDVALEDIDETYLKTKEERVDDFLNRYGSNDQTVSKILERHPEWQNALVVADWTGSMYQHGAQALYWHIKNFEHSGLTYFTLFNDGDDKSTPRKHIGETEGIYHEKANNMEKLIALYYYVMLQGSGGDGPENDIEALIAGIEKYPKADEIILIADNNACIRDIELADKIGRPVHIIICGSGYTGSVNAQYVNLAVKTGGSIHTIEQDIAHFETMESPSGDGVFYKDPGIKIEDFLCDAGLLSEDMSGALYTSFDEAKESRTNVRMLVLSGQELGVLPPGIRRMERLEMIDLSDNKLKRLGKQVCKIKTLRVLDMHENRLKKLPEHVNWLRYLRQLDVSNNQLSEIHSGSLKLPYLEYLNLSNNQLSVLPSTLRYCKNLEELHLSGNALEKLPAFTSLKKLKVLDVSHNSLTEIPKLSRLRYLEALNLSHNELEEVPRSLYNLKAIKELDISGNNIPEQELQKLRDALPNTQITF